MKFVQNEQDNLKSKSFDNKTTTKSFSQNQIPNSDSFLMKTEDYNSDFLNDKVISNQDIRIEYSEESNYDQQNDFLILTINEDEQSEF